MPVPTLLGGLRDPLEWGAEKRTDSRTPCVHTVAPGAALPAWGGPGGDCRLKFSLDLGQQLFTLRG
ncbi:hypothetical protein GCM10027073_60670 [Streptomyces chlorus]